MAAISSMLAAGAATSVISGAIGAGKAAKAERAARRAKNEAKLKLEATLADRQDIINPYAGITDLSGLASDLSSQITNPFNNLYCFS